MPVATRRSATRRLVLSCLAALLPGCGGPPVDLKQGLEITVVSTGWFDAGIVNGNNKLVPSISFTIKNVSSQPLTGLQMMGSFFRVTDTNSEWGNNLLSVTTRGQELAPGATTPTLTIRSPLGYTGTEARADMLKNSHFVDAMVKLVSKYGPTQWTHVKEVPIERRLVTQ
jgi:hypothetical protein